MKKIDSIINGIEKWSLDKIEKLAEEVENYALCASGERGATISAEMAIMICRFKTHERVQLSQQLKEAVIQVRQFAAKKKAAAEIQPHLTLAEAKYCSAEGIDPFEFLKRKNS